MAVKGLSQKLEIGLDTTPSTAKSKQLKKLTDIHILIFTSHITITEKRMTLSMNERPEKYALCCLNTGETNL